MGSRALAKDLINAYLACTEDFIFHKPVMNLHKLSENDPLAIAQRRQAPSFKVQAMLPGDIAKERRLTFHGTSILLLHSSGLVTSEFPMLHLAYIEADTHTPTRLNLVIAQVNDPHNTAQDLLP